VVARLTGAGTTGLGAVAGLATPAPRTSWRVLLSSESATFTANGTAVEVELAGAAPCLRFSGPAAVVLACTAAPERSRAH
jgi:hypothetical protein